jgi:hypothetical protein
MSNKPSPLHNRDLNLSVLKQLQPFANVIHKCLLLIQIMEKKIVEAHVNFYNKAIAQIGSIVRDCWLEVSLHTEGPATKVFSGFPRSKSKC